MLVKPEWRDFFAEENFEHVKVASVAIDEVHTMIDWATFRPKYNCVPSVLDNMAPDIPLNLLTATCTPDMLDAILNCVGLKKENIKQVVKVPNRYDSFCAGIHWIWITLNSCESYALVYLQLYNLILQIQHLSGVGRLSKPQADWIIGSLHSWAVQQGKRCTQNSHLHQVSGMFMRHSHNILCPRKTLPYSTCINMQYIYITQTKVTFQWCNLIVTVCKHLWRSNFKLSYINYSVKKDET